MHAFPAALARRLITAAQNNRLGAKSIKKIALTRFKKGPSIKPRINGGKRRRFTGSSQAAFGGQRAGVNAAGYSGAQQLEDAPAFHKPKQKTGYNRASR